MLTAIIIIFSNVADVMFQMNVHGLLVGSVLLGIPLAYYWWTAPSSKLSEDIKGEAQTKESQCL
jgi:hypothetical protein